MNNLELISGEQQNQQVDIKLVVSIVVLSLMVLIRDLGYFAFTPIYFISVVSIISLILPYRSLISFFFFYITVGISVHGIALIPLVLALILKNKKINIFQITFTIIILLYELLHFASYTFSTDFNLYIIYALYIILFFFILFDDNLNDNAKDGMRYYILGTVVASLIIFAHSIIVFGFQDMMFESFRMGASFEDYDIEKEMVTKMNPNQLAFYVITAFSLLLYIKNLFHNQMIKVTLMIELVFAGLMSGSRTWIIVMAIVVALFLLFSNTKAKFSLVLAAAVLFVLALRYNNYTEAVYSRYEDRFEESSTRTGGHRTEIMKDYNHWLANNPQRCAYGAGALYYTKICEISYSTHNSTQQIIVCYGVFGLLIFIACIVLYHNRYTKPNKARFWYYFPFIICVIFSQTGQFLNPACMMLPFVATALPFKLKEDAR